MAKNLVDKAVEFVNRTREAAKQGNVTASPDPALLDEDAMRAANEAVYDEEVYAFLEGIRNEEDRKKAREYIKRLNDRAVDFYGSMTANLMRLSKEIEVQVMEDSEISRAIENHFKDEGEKLGWPEDEVKRHTAEAKECLTTFLFNDVVTKYSFHATVKYNHHNDVAYGTFLNSFFSRLTDPKVRARAMARAREFLLDEGYSNEEINKMFSAQNQRNIKMEPEFVTVRDRNGRKREIVKSLYMKETGLQSEVWKLLKQNDVMKATEMIDQVAAKTGMPPHLVAEAVAMVGKTTAMFRGLPPEIKSRMLEFLNRVQEVYAANTKALVESRAEGTEMMENGQPLAAGPAGAPATADAGQSEPARDPVHTPYDRKDAPQSAAEGATVKDIRTGQPVKGMTAEEFLDGIYEEEYPGKGVPDTPHTPLHDDDGPDTSGPSGPGGM